MTPWEGDLAVVTGGASGIGLGVARALGRSGIGVSVLCPGAVATDLPASGSHRPARFGGPVERPQDAFLKDFMAGALSPDAVGDLVVQAIGQAQFYIFTHRSLRAPIEQRHARILAALDRVPA